MAAGGAGTGALSLALIWTLWEETLSWGWVGTGVFAFMLPGVIVAGAAGWAADRWNARRVCLFGWAGLIASTAAWWLLWAAGHLGVWSAMVVLAVRGVAANTALVSWRSLVPQTLPASLTSQGSRLDVAASNISRLTGPLLAILLSWQFNAAAVFAAGVAAEMWMAAEIRRCPVAGTANPDQRKIFAGWRATALSPEIFAVMISGGVILAAASRGLWEIAPGLAATSYGSDLAGFGTVMTAFGAGIAAGIGFGVFVARNWDFQKSAVGFLSFAAVGIAGIGLAENQTAAAMFFGLAGASHSWCATASNGEITARSPTRLRASSLGGYVALVSLSVAAGSFIGGWAADIWGIRTAHLAAASLLAASAVANLAKRR